MGDGLNLTRDNKPDVHIIVIFIFVSAFVEQTSDTANETIKMYLIVQRVFWNTIFHMTTSFFMWH